MRGVGTAAPDFLAKDERGNEVRLSALRGKWIVLYFYPKDETVGCTVEACAFRDHLHSLSDVGAEVLGISVQDVDSHRRFAERHRLNFHLLADPEKRVTRMYGALGFLGLAKRVTYLIDPQGVIRDAHRSEIDPKGHVDHVRDKLREFGVSAA